MHTRSFSRFLVFALCAFALRVHAANQVTAFLWVTNSADHSNSLTFNSTDIRYAVTNVTNSAIQWPVTNTAAWTATNLLGHLASYPPLGLAAYGVQKSDSNAAVLVITAPGTSNLTVVPTGSGGSNWAWVRYETNVFSASTNLPLPIATYTNLIGRSNLVSAIAEWLNYYPRGTDKVSALAQLFTNFLGANFKFGNYTNKSFANGNLYDFTLYNPSIVDYIFLDNPGFRFFLPDTSTVAFTNANDGQWWDFNDGPILPKGPGTLPRLGDFIPDQFTYDATTGQIYFKEGAQTTNTFLVDPTVSGVADIASAIVRSGYTTNSAGDFAELRVDLLTTYGGNTTNTHGQFSTLHAGTAWSSNLIAPISLNATNVNLSNVVAQQLSLARVALSDSNWISGTLGLDVGTYTDLGNGAATTNIVQLATNMITVLSGNTADASIISMKDAPTSGRLAIVVNGSSYNHTFLHDSPLESVSERRMSLPGSAAASIAPGGSAIFWYKATAQRWTMISPQPLTSLTLITSTNQITFGATNSPPSNTATVRKWISVTVNGETNAYRLPLYE